MTTMPKYVQLNNWIFELKAVRAIRVDNYGDPYSAITNISINGDSAYLDGLMTKQEDAFTRHDFQTFVEFFRQIDIKQVNFDRFKNQQLTSEQVIIEPKQPRSLLQLVK